MWQGRAVTFDVETFRSEFPAMSDGVAYFDGAGGTQTPAVVAAAISDVLRAPLSNKGALSQAARNAESAVVAFRSAYGDLTGRPPEGVVHGRSATALTFDLAGALSRTWSAGDRIVVSRLDHDCNVRPWVVAAERAGVTVRWLEIDPDTASFAAGAESVIDERTRLVAVCAASNLLGTRPDVPALAAAAHAVGAYLWVDGVHHAAHSFVDAAQLGADFYVCSPYKFFGPHCGVLVADPAVLETISPDKLLPSANSVPERFELGTLPYEQLAGATAAVEFMASYGSGPTRRDRLASAHRAFGGHEEELSRALTAGVSDLVRAGQAVSWSRAGHRTPTTLLTFPGVQAATVAGRLAERDVIAPAGSFYAYEPSRALELGETGGLRISLAPYNTTEEIDRLLDGLRDLLI